MYLSVRESADSDPKADGHAVQRVRAQDGSIEQIRIQNIYRVLAVDDLEDFGPGFLLSTSDGEHVYLAGEMLDPFAESEELAETCEVERYRGTDELVSVRVTGPRVAESGSISVSRIPVREFAACEILQREPHE